MTKTGIIYHDGGPAAGHCLCREADGLLIRRGHCGLLVGTMPVTGPDALTVLAYLDSLPAGRPGGYWSGISPIVPDAVAEAAGRLYAGHVDHLARHPQDAGTPISMDDRSYYWGSGR